MRRTAALIILLLLVFTGAMAPAASAARARDPETLRFGIGDQHPAMFADPRWQSLGLRITRYNVPWDAADDPATLARAVEFVTAARTAGVQVLLHVTGQIVDGTREALPTRLAYRTQIRRLVAIFRPLGVRTWGAWNEANHPTQPTITHPERAAQFFLELRAACTGCTVVALDLLTQGNPSSRGKPTYRGYAQRFFAALGSRRSLVKVVGIHNYGELLETKGPYKSRDLARYVRRWAPRARFWITESGGVAANRSRVCDEHRQVIGTRRMFSQAISLMADGIDRLYLYNWTADQCNILFDSGLIRADGTARPALVSVIHGAAKVGR